jgi:hypothetical protein
MSDDYRHWQICAGKNDMQVTFTMEQDQVDAIVMAKLEDHIEDCYVHKFSKIEQSEINKKVTDALWVVYEYLAGDYRVQELKETIETKLKNCLQDLEKKTMNRDDIIRMAGHREVPPWVMKLVQDCVDAEREECAKVCEETTVPWTQHVYNGACMACAVSIRARGMK